MGLRSLGNFLFEWYGGRYDFYLVFSGVRVMIEGKIKRLAPEEIQKIAAGEVVERPVSVLKELLENAIDAGASTVSVYIEQAGKKLIRVVDDGCGMSSVDARMAFQPHATSKITSVDDLYSVASYGFRGEALASIASVSRVTLLTAQAGHEDVATKIQIDQGKLISCDQVCARAGTDLAVRDLFCAVPVRLKFLKKDETEWNQLYDLEQAVAFCLPGMNFSLYRDGQLALHAPAVRSVLERARQLWDISLAQHLIEFSSERGLECAVRGLVSRTNVHRYNRSDIFLFVNGRWVKNQNLVKAVLKGYAQSLPQGKFPMAVIFITLDSARVDVNVHPRKEEVAFISPGRVESAVTDAVRAALESSVVQATVFHEPESEKRSEEQRFEPVHSQTSPVLQSTFFERKTMPERTVFHDFSIQRTAKPVQPTFFEQKMPAQSTIFFPSDSLVEEPQKNISWRVCGQLFATYVLIEADGQFLLMDQHAAHERILYERMKSGYESFVAVQLLFPQVLTFSERLVAQLLQAQEYLAACGIAIERFGEAQIRVSSFPIEASRLDFTTFFGELAQACASDAVTTQGLRKKIYEHVHSHAACKAAVKAGDVLTLQEMAGLYQDLQEVENRHMCIHGRPTIWKISKQEIEKQFRRI